MKNKFFLATILLIITSSISINKCFSQTTKYINGTIVYSINGKEKPLGKNVTVVYDHFFKSYMISFTDLNGDRYKLTFQYENESRYSNNGVLYDCIFCENSLSYAHKGTGFLLLTDLRQEIYGGTGKSYKINNLSYGKK